MHVDSLDGSTTGELTDDDFVGLAGFRYALRQFLSFSEATVKSAGVTAQQYQAVLALRAHEGHELTMKQLAQELLLKPNGAVQLVDRLELMGLVSRVDSPSDRRSVRVKITERGERVIMALAAEHLAELVRQRPLLVDSLRRLKSLADHS